VHTLVFFVTLSSGTSSDFDIYNDPYQNETGSDDIWDHPYIIDGNNQDNYPIVPEFSTMIVLPIFVTATASAVIVCKRKRSSPKRCNKLSGDNSFFELVMTSTCIFLEIDPFCHGRKD